MGVASGEAGKRDGFGELVRGRRVAAGLTQEELAERSGLGVRTISDIERGRIGRPHRRSVDLLCRALGLAGPGRDKTARAASGGAGAPAAALADRGGDAAGGARQPPVVPRQLPASVGYFAGRSDELKVLDELLDGAEDAPGTVVISIAGTAGVGKTALAVHWAHQVASRFPDGQLYVNLRGFGPSGQPIAPVDAIRDFLYAFQPAAPHIPASLDAQAGLYRSLLAGKRMLIVLDNAGDDDQVRPLLPGSPGCLVLVTSRNQLSGLVAANGAHLLALDVLTEPEAQEMLGLRLAPDRIAAAPAAVTALAELCARLPLALSIAAARVAARPGSLAELAAELRDTQARLDALHTEDAATDVRTVLSWSCRQLSEPAARMFRLLGVHAGPDITVPAAASLAGVSRPEAQQAIEDLARAHLLTEQVPGRFAFHDLLRAYAAERARSHDSDADLHAAVHRVLDHYLHTACAASLLLSYRDPIMLSPLQPEVVPEELADRQQALAWFRAELQVLLAAVRQATAAGFSVHAWQLPWTIATSLDWYGYWHELAATQTAALAAAEQLGDRAGQAEAHRHLARGRIRLGADADAIAHLTAAIELGGQVGDDTLQARTHHDLGGVFESQGRIQDALRHVEQARQLHHKAGHRWGEALALSALGWLRAQAGSYYEALELCSLAMAIFSELEIRVGQSATLDSLGYIHHQLGHYAEAIACYQRGLDCDAGDRRVRAETLIHLGDSQQASGNQKAAREAWLEALAILEGLQQPDTDRVHARLSQAPSPRRHPRHEARIVSSPLRHGSGGRPKPAVS
jgi:tetratricopeptide (TPR) repeat protein/transcriptional regulator with XRE-family HTH domain